jgi:hypothetical protein
MPRANDATIDRAIRRDRSLLHPDADLTSLTSLTPTALPNDVQIVHVASIEARSESFRIGDENLIVVDKVQASWIRALRLALPPAHSDAWPLFILYHYLLVRLVSAGLPREASALSHRLRRETRNVSRDRTFETGASVAETAGIERFILGHELGHVAYKSGGTEVATLMNTVYECTDDLTRLLRVTFGGDRSLLTEEEQNPRYEDIVQSMKDYINRFVFHEQAEDIANIEPDLLQRANVREILARQNRFTTFADIFERVDFREEAFCDLYALEFRIVEAGGHRVGAEAIAREWWINLHAMFALAAMDSLTRDRRVAGEVHASKRAILQGVDVNALTEAEIYSLHQEIEEIEERRYADRARLFYQVAMIKVIYRRVAMMNYIERHPLLDDPGFLISLREEGERLEKQFLGAGASLRFNLMRLEEEFPAGFNDTLDSADRDDLDRLWSDIVVRIPGIDRVTTPKASNADGAAPPWQQHACAFCGYDFSETRMILTNGRVAMCDQCAFVAGAAFKAMPADIPRRPTVGGSVLLLPPDVTPERADRSKPYCHFCEIAPVANEPLVTSPSGAVICSYCAEGALAIIRIKSPASDPEYIEQRQRSYEGYAKLALEANSQTMAELMAASADDALKDIKRARAPTLPGRELWRLFTEPTAELDLGFPYHFLTE